MSYANQSREVQALSDEVLREFAAAVDMDGIIVELNQRQTYECDGLTALRTVPSAVLLPRSRDEVQAIVRVCARHQIPFVARGAGTGLSGGALPASGGIVLSFARMNKILAVDLPNQRVTVEPGVINTHVTQRVAAAGYFYAPDPSSQTVCTIGGNVAENAGGAHCLKYGFTTTHVLALEVVLPTGELIHPGSPAPDAPGYDLTGVFVGSEGTLGVVTAITLRIVKRPEEVQVLLAAFDTIAAAGQTVSDIIAASILPAAMEIMDRLSIEAAEVSVHPNYPACEALLLVELDYPSASFGTQKLGPGQDFDYRFKLLGSGKLKLIYTDSANVEHTVPGPQLDEGNEGTLSVTIQPSGVQWGSQLKGRKLDEFPIAPN